MSAADQAKGPIAKAVELATTLHAQRFDGSSVESFAEEIDEAAQPLAAALRELLEVLDAGFEPDTTKARDALRGWEKL